jgi:hypothetical protein
MRGPGLPVAARGIAAVLAVGGLAGCGPANSRSSPVTVTVTDGFGARHVRQVVRPAPAQGSTVLDVLRTVTTVTGAPSPHVIAGRAARSGGRWAVFVNGVAPDEAPGATPAHGGERIWFDRHDGRAAPRIPAVVGAFPEPFTHGLDGERLPVRVECAEPGGVACERAVTRFTAAGVPAAPGGLRGSITTHTLRVLVGRWSQLRLEGAAARLERGPGESGVFVRPAPDGRSFTVLDAHGRGGRVLRAGAGLVAATAGPAKEPIWVVAGTDDRGVLRAVGALTERALRNRFAVAVTPEGAELALPDGRN